MPRFSSLKNQPAETRRLLRDRFTRYLPHPEISVMPQARTVTLDDESLLKLLTNLTIRFNSDIKKARAIYNRKRRLNPSEPRLNELISDGWINVVWGRISIPQEISRKIRETSATNQSALATLAENRFEQTYRVAASASSDAELAVVVSEIKRKKLKPSDIGCQTPEWVAARLWDRTVPQCAELSTALRVWVDRCKELDCPSLQPGRMWDERAATAFFTAAFEVLETDRSLVDWGGQREKFVKQLALVNALSQANAESYVPSAPGTVVDRFLWLEDPGIEALAMDSIFEHEDVSTLVRLLLTEVSAETHAPAPHDIAKRLIALAIERPVVLNCMLRYVHWKSELLADLVMFPSTSALAVLLVAQWSSPSSAWDRELIDRDNRTLRMIAFADGVSVMGCFLKKGDLDPGEVASLLDWFHRYPRGGVVGEQANRDTMLESLRDVLAAQSTDLLQSMVKKLTATTTTLGLGSSKFAAALDIVSIGSLADDIEAGDLVSGYIESVTNADYSLSAHRISTGQAVALFKLAKRASNSQCQRFLNHTRIRERLAAVPDKDRLAEERIIGQSLREHIRVLSRAVAGWTENMPEELAQALTNAVRAGALRHEEKGRVATFSPSYEANGLIEPIDRPIAADIGAALRALGDVHRDRLLAAVLETDEPMMLAQLIMEGPETIRERIKNRVAELTPSKAGDIYSLTHVQARIEALLSAGLGEAANWFMEEERELQTWGRGPNPDREMTRLRTALRLNLLRGEWNAISTTEPPPELTHGVRRLAIDTIDFYKAVAALRNPEGDRKIAEKTFARLQKSHPDVGAYVQNLFAARITLLLNGGFGELHDAALLRGRRILEEAEEMMLRVRVIDGSVTDSFQCNKALLLLAMGRSEQALELVASLDTTGLSTTLSAYRAVALAKLERGAEAQAVLAQTERVLGSSDVLRAAREHIMRGGPFRANANISSDDDPVPRAKAALFDLKQMNPDQQAEVLMAQPAPLCAQHAR